MNKQLFEAFRSESGSSRTKTVSLELVPMGKTQQTIEEEKFIERDELRIEDAKIIKSLMDSCHRRHINNVLSELNLDWEPLADTIIGLRENREDKTLLPKLKGLQKKYRKDITKPFAKDKKSYSGATIFELLPKEVELSDISNKEEILRKIDGFTGYTTYFEDFHKKRELLYVEDEKVGSVAYRTVHENFERFLDAIGVYNKMMESFPEIVAECHKEVGEYVPLIKEHSLDEIFSINFYNELLTQTGIESFNKLISGLKLDENTSIKGLNQLAKEYSTRTKEKAIRFEKLYKQVLVEDDSFKFKIGSIEDDKECLELIHQLFEKYEEEGFFENVTKFFSRTWTDTEDIYISRNRISDLSHNVYGRWNKIYDLIRELKTSEYEDPETKKAAKEIDAWCNRKEISLAEIYETVEKMAGESDKLDDYKKLIIEQCNLSRQGYDDFLYLKEHLPEKEGALKLKYNKTLINAIKDVLETTIKIAELMLVYSNRNKKQEEKSEFYILFDELFELATLSRGVYIKTKAYIQKKPYSTKKTKLNFDNASLLGGWSKTKLDVNGGIVLRRGKEYFLAIKNKNKKGLKLEKLVEEIPKTDDTFEAFVIRTVTDALKFVPHVAFTKEVKYHFEAEGNETPFILEGKMIGEGKEPIVITKGIWDTYHEKAFRTEYLKDGGDEETFKKALSDWINFHKIVLANHTSTCIYDLSSLKDEYMNLNDFKNDVNKCMYNVSAVKVDKERIEKCVEDGEILLFKLSSRDLTSYVKYDWDIDRINNLAILYLLSVFTDENLKTLNNRLLGGSKIFFRRASVDKPFVHKKGSVLIEKTDINGEPIPSSVYPELLYYLNGKKNSKLSDEAAKYLVKIKTSIATKDIVKNDRFTKDKYLATFCIGLNSNGRNDYPTVTALNKGINEIVRNNPEDINILAVTRGFQSLINVCIISPKGEILLQKNYDVVNGQDFNKKFVKRVEDLKQQAINWEYVGSIKELQSGYVGLVIPEILNLAMEHNALIAVEDIRNARKKQPYKIENEVYTTLVNGLQNKLNFYPREKKLKEIYDAYQLAVESSNKYISFQNGLLLYVNPAFIDKIDMSTGFANLLRAKDFVKNTSTRKEFFEKLDDFEYVPEEDSFVIKIDYSNYDTTIPSNSIWEIHTPSERWIYIGKDKEVLHRTITTDIKVALMRVGVDFKSKTLLKDILDVPANKENSDFFKTLFTSVYSCFELRVPGTGGDVVDKVNSCVRNTKAKFYETGKDTLLNADMSIAYGTALKAMFMLDEVKLGEEKVKTLYAEEWLNLLENTVLTENI